ncbi:hypothetical protein CGZ92_05335, partial [Parenemella sanctibonifatiensis]
MRSSPLASGRPTGSTQRRSEDRPTGRHVRFQVGIASAPDPLTGPCYGSTFGSNFQHGSIYWTPRTGAHPVTGRIRDTWSTEGWENSPYGYPTTAEQHPGQNAPSHHRIQFFENGFLYWDGQYVTGEWRDPANPLITHPAY